MIEVIFELFFTSVFESSLMTSSKKTKIIHAIFRTMGYLFICGLFVILSVGFDNSERFIYGLISFVFFSAMIITNFNSYKRHKEWNMIKKDFDK
ncbi:hypothetical protein G8C15_17105 [Enterococcus casseliflavus]|nr:hypothetical protein [Enterococcus casseliflavus]MBF0014403.1 hypothetical protein [Enterococcus casseliflavus]